MNTLERLIFIIGLMQSFICLAGQNSSAEQIGAGAAVQLTADVVPIVRRGIVLDEKARTLSAEEARILQDTGRLDAARDGLVADLSSQGGDCPTAPRLAKQETFHLDLEFRAYIVSGFNRDGIRTSYADANFDSLTKDYVRWGRSSLANLSLTEAQKKIIEMMSYGGSELSNSQKKEVFDAVLRDRIVQASPADRRAIYQEAGRLMSFDDQIAFIAKLGGEMSGNYDDARSDQAISATAIPTCDQVLTALGTGQKTGVCRDIHMCMGQVLSDMGNQGHVYGLSFASPGNYHVTLIASDPRNPNRVHTLNYNEHGTSSQSGIAALAQDHSIPDVGISYRLWKPIGDGAGEMVASLPSQMGLVLNEMTGGVNTRDFDPTIRQDYGIISAGGGVGPWNGRVFTANLANGDRVLGVATSVRWGSQANPQRGEIFDGVAHSGSVGLAFAHRVMERPNGAEISQMSINTVYLNFQQRVSVPIRLSDNIVIEPNAGFRLQAAFIEGGFSGDRGLTGDGDTALTLGGSATYTTDNQRTRLRLGASTQLTLGLRDIRGLFGSQVILVPNHTQFGLDAEHEVSADVRLNARFLYVFREYGDTFQATTGVDLTSSTGRTALNVGFLTPVGEANGFMPGGAHPSLLIGLSHSVLSDDRRRSVLDLNVSYTQRLDDGQYMFNTGAALHF